MKTRLGVVLSVLTLAVAGCVVIPATAPSSRGKDWPTTEEINSAYYGSPPSNDAAVLSMIERTIRPQMKDPEAVRFKNFRGKGKGFSISPRGRTPHFGWSYAFEMNGKNSYGGYVGYVPGYAIVQDESLSLLYTLSNSSSRSSYRSETVYVDKHYGN